MRKKTVVTAMAMFALAPMAVMFAGNTEAEAKKAAIVKPAQEKPVNAAACYECHGTVKELHLMGKHSKVNCVSCHGALHGSSTDQHLRH